MSEQYHFEFKDYEQAFEMFYRKKLGYKVEKDRRTLGRIKGNPNICLVISTGFHTSGYWIEENAKTDKDTRVYRSVESVKALESRIKERDGLREQHVIGVKNGLIL